MAISKEQVIKTYAHSIELMQEEDKDYPRLEFNLDAYVNVLNNVNAVVPSPFKNANFLYAQLNELLSLIP